MLEVRELSESDITEILERVGYGHLACCQDDLPYVVPIHYGYDGKRIFIYTTEGKKFDIISKNPNVCLQVEDVVDNEHWHSVIVDGVAERLAGKERDHALKLILRDNPRLTPAVSIRWMDAWVRENHEVIYSITITQTSGRRTVDRQSRIPSVRIGGPKSSIV